jgi:hypothetical protein
MNATLPMKASAATCAVLLSIYSSRAYAQQSASLALTGGVATDQRGVQSNALTIAPGLRLDGAQSSIQLGGSATKYETSIWSLGAAAAFAAREPIGSHAAMTLDASASITKLGGSFDARYGEAAVLPAIQVAIRRLTLFGGARAAGGSATIRTKTTQAELLGPTPGSESVRETRGGAGPVYGALLALSPTARIGGREERMTVAGADIIDRSLSMDVSAGRLRLGAAAGERMADDERAGFGSVSASIDLTSAASLDVAAGRFPRNRLLGTPAGSFFTAGVSLRTGGALADPPQPKPSGAPAIPRGMTRLALRAADATRVELAGDFNNWRPTPATRSANGVWYADLRIEPGQYRYAFRVDGRDWRVPDGATAVDDGFGGKSAWITVRDTPTR